MLVASTGRPLGADLDERTNVRLVQPQSLSIGQLHMVTNRKRPIPLQPPIPN